MGVVIVTNTACGVEPFGSGITVRDLRHGSPGLVLRYPDKRPERKLYHAQQFIVVASR